MLDMGREIFKNIADYEDYQISNKGNVKSLKSGKGKILKAKKTTNGYLFVCLRKNSTNKWIMIHKLVAISFLNYIADNRGIVIDHIDNNRLNNQVNNLQIITQRANTSKDQNKQKTSSKFTGVTLHKRSKKWYASIRIKDKSKFLGSFNNEIEASKAYQKELKTLTI